MNILDSIKTNAGRLQLINFNHDAIKDLATNLKLTDLEFLEADWVNHKFELSDLLQFMFFLNSINFCYWAEKNTPKWTINFDGEKLGGMKTLVKALETKIKDDPKFLIAENIAKMPKEEFRTMLTGNIEIPMFEERYKNITETAEILVKNFEGKFSNLLDQSKNSAPILLKNIVKNFPSFEDKSIYKGSEVLFYKRAQLQVKMTNDALLSVGKDGLENLDQLTAFSDYKVPQLLRHLGIIKYAETLSKQIDNYELISKDSDEENEIRIATVWAVELIRQEIEKKYPHITASHIDSLLWSKTQNNGPDIKPNHRTYTTAY